MLREHYGRGPMKAKTYVLDDLIVCVLRNGHTPMEETMMEGGEPERVLGNAPGLPAAHRREVQTRDRAADRPTGSRVPEPDAC